MARYQELDALDQATLADWYAPGDKTWLRVNLVSSADGAVEVNGDSKALSGPDDMRVFRILRMRCDVLLVGAGTVRTDGYRPLKMNEERRDWRAARGLPEHPVMAVVTREGQLDLDAAMFTDSPRRPIVVTCESGYHPELSTVADVIVAGGDAVDFATALDQLRQRGLAHVLCEGGPHILGELTSADLLDELCLTLSPNLAGPGSGRITTGPASSLRPMELAHTLHARGNLLLRYVRRRD